MPPGAGSFDGSGAGTEAAAGAGRDGLSDAVAWARRELTPDGVRRALGLAARFLGGIRLLSLAVLVFGLAVAAVVVLTRDPGSGGRVAVLLALCLPAVVAPLVARRRLGRLARTLDRPDEAVAQARDLAGRLRDSAELRELAARARRSGRRSDPGPVAGRRGGRLRRAVRTGKLASAVIGQVQPDEDAHPLLVPLVPERLAGLWAALAWCLWGLLLAWIAAVIAIVAAIL